MSARHSRSLGRARLGPYSAFSGILFIFSLTRAAARRSFILLIFPFEWDRLTLY